MLKARRNKQGEKVIVGCILCYVGRTEDRWCDSCEHDCCNRLMKAQAYIDEGWDITDLDRRKL